MSATHRAVAEQARIVRRIAAVLYPLTAVAVCVGLTL